MFQGVGSRRRSRLCSHDCVGGRSAPLPRCQYCGPDLVGPWQTTRSKDHQIRAQIRLDRDHTRRTSYVHHSEHSATVDGTASRRYPPHSLSASKDSPRHVASRRPRRRASRSAVYAARSAVLVRVHITKPAAAPSTPRRSLGAGRGRGRGRASGLRALAARGQVSPAEVWARASPAASTAASTALTCRSSPNRTAARRAS